MVPYRPISPYSRGCSHAKLSSRLAGNTILRATHHANYTHNAAAACIGAVGGSIIATSIMLLTIIFAWCRQRKWDVHVEIKRGVIEVLVVIGVPISAATGTAVLLAAGVDLGRIVIWHAMGAGALGSTIVLLPYIFFIIAGRMSR